MVLLPLPLPDLWAPPFTVLRDKTRYEVMFVAATVDHFECHTCDLGHFRRDAWPWRQWLELLLIAHSSLPVARAHFSMSARFHTRPTLSVAAGAGKVRSFSMI
jgi:hypothetical protein